jgi:hypothetical protein
MTSIGWRSTHYKANTTTRPIAQEEVVAEQARGHLSDMGGKYLRVILLVLYLFLTSNSIDEKSCFFKRFQKSLNFLGTITEYW